MRLTTVDVEDGCVVRRAYGDDLPDTWHVIPVHLISHFESEITEYNSTKYPYRMVFHFHMKNGQTETFGMINTKDQYNRLIKLFKKEVFGVGMDAPAKTRGEQLFGD